MDDLLGIPIAQIEKGGQYFEQLSPARQEFFHQVTARMADGQVLLDADLLKTARIIHTDYDIAGRLFDTTTTEYVKRLRVGAIMMHLNVVLFRGEIGMVGNRKGIRTYHDAQLPAAQTNIELVMRKLSGLPPGYPLSTDIQTQLELWKASANSAFQQVRDYSRRMRLLAGSSR